MNFQEQLRSLLQESIQFENTPAEINSVTYDNGLAYNDDKKKIISQFINYVIEKLGLKKIPKITFISERIKGMTTGAYNPKEDKVYVLANNRMLADMLRTVAHELVHAMQRETGKFKIGDTVQDAGGDIENEANAKSGELIKTFVRDLQMEVIYSL